MMLATRTTNARAAESGHDRTGDDAGNQPLAWCDAGRDTEGNRQWNRHNADDDPGADVAKPAFAGQFGADVQDLRAKAGHPAR